MHARHCARPRVEENIWRLLIERNNWRVPINDNGNREIGEFRRHVCVACACALAFVPRLLMHVHTYSRVYSRQCTCRYKRAS